MYSLEDILDQAIEDNRLSKYEDRNEVSIIDKGIKITKDKPTGIITMLDVTQAKHYYTKLSQSQVNIFKSYGWCQGLNTLSIFNKKHKLRLIGDKIKKLINMKKFSQRKYDELKASRLRNMKQLAQLINLNQIK